MCNSILDMVENTGEKFLQKIAIEDEVSKYTFGELLEISKGIATQILPYVSIAGPVVFCMEKSAKAVCGLLGVVYAGGAYCFVDVNQPIYRMQMIVDTVKPTLIISDHINKENAISIAKSSECKVIILDEIFGNKTIDQMSLNIRREKIIDNQPLYINFTSGSTGKPKGVVVTHRSVIDFIPNFVEVMDINSDDILGNQAPFDFDVSVKDIYSCFYTGASLVLVPRKYFTQPIVLMDYLCDKKISILIWAVSALCFITTMKGLEYKCPTTIRCIGFSGEVMPIKHYNKLKKYLCDTKFVNLYGPTEITCNCTYYIIPKNKEYDLDESIPIGKNFKNKKVFLLDDQNKLIKSDSPNELGEICVSGTCLALGYYNNYDKTKEVFVQNPLQSNYHEIIYRTGDLARYDEYENLIYVSRKDFQIKHMGHRIELGEIETMAMSIYGVDRAMCLYDFNKKKIVLFYTGTCNKDDIFIELKDKIPSFMIPNKLIFLEKIPLNKNGKVDRSKLKELL